MSRPCPRPGLAEGARLCPQTHSHAGEGQGVGAEAHGFEPTWMTVLFMLFPGRDTRAGPVYTLAGFSFGHRAAGGAHGSSMSRNSCLGGAAPRYHAQEPSLLLMQAKNLAWCPLMFFSVTQSIQRHSSGEEM